MSDKKLVFSGVQPTGNLHLGNYLGALKKFESLQKEMECIYCVVDLHAITVFQKPSELSNNVFERILVSLALSKQINMFLVSFMKLLIIAAFVPRSVFQSIRRPRWRARQAFPIASSASNLPPPPIAITP